jgi:hypothetical protein
MPSFVASVIRASESEIAGKVYGTYNSVRNADNGRRDKPVTAHLPLTWPEDWPRICPKAHPRGGFMLLERDNFGLYCYCFNCGYLHENLPKQTQEEIDAIDSVHGQPRQRRRQPSHGKLRL